MAEGTRGQAGGGNNNKTTARGQRGAEQRQQPDAGTSAPEEIEYPIGSKVQGVASFDNCSHPAEVLNRKVLDGRVCYYVHYLDCDKRLDEWVTGDKLVPAQSNGSLSRLETMPSIALGSGDLIGSGAGDQKITRRLKRKIEDLHHMPSSHLDESKDHGQEKDHGEHARVKNIDVVEFGRFDMDTWYYSPYPEPYGSQKKLYICEYTLKYFRKKRTLLRHLAKLDRRHPPGDEIYRSPPPPPNNPNYVGGAVANPTIAVFEVDGRKNKVYCQNLCLLSKLFLDHKTLYYDVDPFLFYVLCELDEDGYHTVGYFSKEKNCQDNYNLACILVLPAFQRKGYGKFLIAFAYQLSRLEGKMGTAERPLSDLGAVSFKSYWTKAVLDVLRDSKNDISVQDISERTNMLPSDISDTLKQLGLLQYWKGSHYICANPKVVEDHWRAIANQRTLDVDPKYLHWQPLPPAAPPKAK